GIRHFEHLALSFVHVARDDQIVSPAHRMFTRDQKLGNDSCHSAAVIKNRLGDCAHHADGATAENQPDAIFGENRAEGAGAPNKGGLSAGAGSEIDEIFSVFAAFFDLVHNMDVRCGCGIVRATYQKPRTDLRRWGKRVPTGPKPPIST